MAAANTDPFFVLKNMARNLELRVGVLEGATYTDESGRTIPVAEYAIYNEFGATIRVTPKMRAFLHYKGIHLSAETEELHIPARPAVRTTVDEYGDDWAQTLAGLLNRGLDPEMALRQVGELASADMKRTIESWSQPPNAPATIESKRSRRDNPLVDSGDYVDSIDYEVRGGRQ
ncbi:MAG TPA: hypothetical protein K8U76_02735 [Bilophila wadsworthia]|uniref:hypothetical protein n=1 Tax=Bilophila wadsworthia TaxID=35833 RepID=UPI001E14ADD3|nr:hypothetical protein [Bilophila wadsworthia]HJH14168.1 hypothetical protein [Bilophila wadsworthia]